MSFSFTNIVFVICGYHDYCSTRHTNYSEFTGVSIVAMITLACAKCFARRKFSNLFIPASVRLILLKKLAKPAALCDTSW